MSGDSLLVIDAIVADAQRTHLAHVYIGDEDLVVDVVHVAELGLRAGQPVTPEVMEDLRELAQVAAAKGRALSLLAGRAYTEKELSDRLMRHEFDLRSIEKVIVWLRELGYVDDATYAERWVEHRRHTKGLGPVRLRHELRERGIAPDIVDAAVGSVSDEEHENTAMELARARLARMGQAPLPKARRQLYGYLLRRGFTNATVVKVLSRLFDEFPA